MEEIDNNDNKVLKGFTSQSQVSMTLKKKVFENFEWKEMNAADNFLSFPLCFLSNFLLYSLCFLPY